MAPMYLSKSLVTLVKSYKKHSVTIQNTKQTLCHRKNIPWKTLNNKTIKNLSSLLIDWILNHICRYVPTTSSSSSGGNYRYGPYGACPRHPHGGCACASLYSHPAHPAHPTHPHQHALDHFVRPPPPADPADIMQTGNYLLLFIVTLNQNYAMIRHI